MEMFILKQTYQNLIISYETLHSQNRIIIVKA